MGWLLSSGVLIGKLFLIGEIDSVYSVRTGPVLSDDLVSRKVDLSIQKDTGKSVRRSVRYVVYKSASDERTMTIFRHCIWFNGKEAVCFQYEEDVVLYVWSQHSVSSYSYYIVADAVIYAWIYDLFEIV